MLLFRDFLERFGQAEPGDPDYPAFDDVTESLVVSLMSIGSLVGALSGAYTADWWGRRWSLSFGVLIFIIGNVLQITAMTSWVHLMVGRLVAGFGVGSLRFVGSRYHEGSRRSCTNAVAVLEYRCTSPNAVLVRFAVLLWLRKTSPGLFQKL